MLIQQMARKGHLLTGLVNPEFSGIDRDGDLYTPDLGDKINIIFLCPH